MLDNFFALCQFLYSQIMSTIGMIPPERLYTFAVIAAAIYLGRLIARRLAGLSEYLIWAFIVFYACRFFGVAF